MGGIGESQFTTINWAVKNGFGVRVGLEDNIWLNKARKEHATNLKLIKYVHEKINEYDTQFMTAKEFGNEGFYNTKRD